MTPSSKYSDQSVVVCARSATSAASGPHIFLLILSCLLVISLAGCGTTTKRVATEQLLMSDAVDQAIAQIDFSDLRDQKVFLDTAYIKTLKDAGFVNSDYVVSSLRQQLTASRCLLQDKIEEADVVVEPRVGALGTDGHEVVYGMPQSNNLSAAASAVSNNPIPVIPEISLGKNNAQSGIAKILVYAYDRESREPIWQSGIAKAESTSKDMWLLGAGPIQRGSIYEGTRFAGKKFNPRTRHNKSNSSPAMASNVPLDEAYTFPGRNKAVTADNGGRSVDSTASKNSSPESNDFSVQPATYSEPLD